MKSFFKVTALCAALCLVLAGCSSIDPVIPEIEDQANFVFTQFQEPQPGDYKVVMSTSKGDIELTLFPNHAPVIVDNFIQLVEEGFYDGQVVFGIEPEIAFMAGSPVEDGTEAKTVTGEPLEKEIVIDLHPYAGALAALSSEDGYSDSRYCIFGAYPLDEDTEAGMLEMNYPQILVDKYKEVGGFPGVYGYYTIFGQVVQGMDVVEAIIACYDVEGEAITETITINSITVSRY